MPRYKVVICETVTYLVEVEARCMRHAREAAIERLTDEGEEKFLYSVEERNVDHVEPLDNVEA